MTYVWVEGQERTSVEVRKFEENSFNVFGDNALADALAADDSYQWRTVTFRDETPLLLSEVVTDISGDNPLSYANGDAYTIQFHRSVDTRTITSRSWTTGGGWLRSRTNHTEVTIIEGQTDYFTHTLRGDYPIDIQFIGGSATSNVNVDSVGGVIGQGDVRVPEGSQVQFNSTAGDVEFAETVGSVSYTHLTLPTICSV